MTKAQLAARLGQTEGNLLYGTGWTAEQWTRHYQRQPKAYLVERWERIQRDAQTRLANPETAHPMQLRWARRVQEVATA